MDFLSFLRGGGGYGAYPTVPIMRPHITGAAMPNWGQLAQYLAMVRGRSPLDRPKRLENLDLPGDFIGTIHTDPYTGVSRV